MAINIQLAIGDAKGDVSTVTIPIPSSTSMNDAYLFAQEIAKLVEPLVNGTLRSLRVNFEVPFTPWAVASSIADIQEKARFSFRTVGNFLKSISLPTILESIFTPGSAQVDTSDADVAAFVTAMTDGIDLTGVGGSGTIEPSDARDADLTSLEAAVEAWGKSRG